MRVGQINLSLTCATDQQNERRFGWPSYPSSAGLFATRGYAGATNVTTAGISFRPRGESARTAVRKKPNQGANRHGDSLATAGRTTTTCAEPADCRFASHPKQTWRSSILWLRSMPGSVSWVGQLQRVQRGKSPNWPWSLPARACCYMALMGGYQALRPSITFSQLWKDTHQR